MRILYLYPRSMDGELQKVAAGQAPSDRLYGLVELKRRGHQVALIDSRFQGRFGRLTKRLRPFASVYDPHTLRSLLDYDVVVVKDVFSTMLTMACRSMGRKIVYLDSFFDPPRRAWKSAALRANLRLADGLVAYSSTQIDVWSARFGVPRERFTFLPYTLDVPFYVARTPPPPGEAPYVLSVGRDLGRRFDTLVEAMDGLGLKLKLVTLPYLLKGVDTSRPWIEVHANLPYERLFELYAGALVVVVPLKTGMTYPSGIRGVLEAMALGKAVIATRTPVLEEYAAEGEGLVYVEPDDPDQLRSTIEALRADRSRAEALGNEGRRLVNERYTMESFVRPLESCLQAVTGHRTG
jgi:glycosyltransferase involved in cell wall biosynthesis